MEMMQQPLRRAQVKVNAGPAKKRGDVWKRIKRNIEENELGQWRTVDHMPGKPKEPDASAP